MRLVLFLSCAVGFLRVGLAQAQADTAAPPAFSPWSLGVRLGTGFNPAAETSDGTFTTFTGGLTGSYHDAPHRCSLQLGAWLENEPVNPYQTSPTHNALLVLPLLLRTGSPASRVHFVVGGGPAIHLTQRAIPNVHYPFDYRYCRTVACLVTSLEVRLTPPKRLETSLALTLRIPFGPSLERTNYSSRAPGSYPDQVSMGWLGATLSVCLHPAARPAPVAIPVD